MANLVVLVIALCVASAAQAQEKKLQRPLQLCEKSCLSTPVAKQKSKKAVAQAPAFLGLGW